MNYDPSRTYTVSDTEPTNPIIDKHYVLFISDIRDEGFDEETGNHVWSYKRDGDMPIEQYHKLREGIVEEEIRLAEARAVTTAFEATLDLIGE